MAEPKASSQKVRPLNEDELFDIVGCSAAYISKLIEIARVRNAIYLEQDYALRKHFGHDYDGRRVPKKSLQQIAITINRYNNSTLTEQMVQTRIVDGIKALKRILNEFPEPPVRRIKVS